MLEHYGLRSSRITPGRAHENGVAEQAHRRLKALVAQALVLRGHADFATVLTYEAFVRAVVERWRNGAISERLIADRAALQALPPAAIPATRFIWPSSGAGARFVSHTARIPCRPA